MTHATHSNSRQDRRQWPQRLVGTLLSLCLSCAAFAADGWPSKPITLVVPFAAGSGSEVAARFYAKALKDKFNATAVVDLKPGASGMIGGAFAAKAAPDGYTVLVGSGTVNAANYFLYKDRINYAPDQFMAVSTIFIAPPLMYVPKNSKADSVPAYLKDLQSNGQAINCGAGNSVTKVACQVLGQRTGIGLAAVSYKGNSQSLLDLAAGRLSFAFSDSAAAVSLVANGSIRPLAAPTSSRLPDMPDVKTFAEQGIPDFEFLSWVTLFVPAKTPPEIANRLNAAALDMLRSPEFQEFSKRIGGLPVTGDLKDAERFVSNDVARWERYVRESGAKGE